MRKTTKPAAKRKTTTRADKVDRLGELKEQIAALQEEYDALESSLRRRLGTTEGEHYAYTSFEVEGKKFMHARAKRLLGEAAYKSCWKANPYRSSKLTALD